MTRIIMNGCNGHMGRVITEIVESDKDAQIVAGVDIVAPPMAPYPVYSSVADVKEEADVIIDFSTPKILTKLIEEAQKRNIALVLCTTGYTKEQIAEIDEASKTTAIVRSANMSLGVNVLLRLVQEAAKKLAAEGFDIEIVEKHHHFKKDAPSGTALAIADAINEALPEALPYVYDRSGRRARSASAPYAAARSLVNMKLCSAARTRSSRFRTWRTRRRSSAREPLLRRSTLPARAPDCTR